MKNRMKIFWAFVLVVAFLITVILIKTNLFKNDSKLVSIMKSIPGWEQINERYLFELAYFECGLDVRLKSRYPEIIDEVWWIVPFHLGKPSLNWFDLLDLINEHENRIKEFNWIVDWKNVDKGRYIRIEIDSATTTDAFGIRSISWKQSKIKGNPKYYIELFKDTAVVGHEIALPDSGKEAIICNAKFTNYSRHWLDSLDIFYESFGKVDSNGKYEIIDHDLNELRKWHSENETGDLLEIQKAIQTCSEENNSALNIKSKSLYEVYMK